MTNLITSDQKRLIIGMGQTGLSCARFLTAKGLSFDLCDTRELLPNQADIKSEFSQCQIFNGKLDGALLAQYNELIVSPGIAIAEPAIVFARQQGSRVRGDVDIFAEFVTKPVIGITGSNGKSTVTTLVGEILAAAGHKPAVCGNIGIPVLDVLLNDDDYHCYVVELSSFQLETTHHLAAEVACVLNLSEDHMDRYDSMLAYHQAKHRVFQGCRSIVTNREDTLTQPLVSTSMPKKSFGLKMASNPVAAKNQYSIAQVETAAGLSVESLMFEQQPIFPVTELKIKGRHNQLNALAAIALVESLPANFKVSRNELQQSLFDFTGLPHRCAWVAEYEGIEYFNDSKGTNVGSTLAAIEGLASEDSKKIILIAGGVGKDQDFEPLADACQKSVKQVQLFGRDAKLIASRLESVCSLDIVETLAQALVQAQQVASAGDVILFSPACASFDQFTNYVNRGETFEQLVAEMIQGRKNS
ncbi:MAG: UDP-N-acetylmuramoyl-L-alanine--D-glutamate ligase [Oleispira sp.]